MLEYGHVQYKNSGKGNEYVFVIEQRYLESIWKGLEVDHRRLKHGTLACLVPRARERVG